MEKYLEETIIFYEHFHVINIIFIYYVNGFVPLYIYVYVLKNIKF